MSSAGRLMLEPHMAAVHAADLMVGAAWAAHGICVADACWSNADSCCPSGQPTWPTSLSEP